MHDALEQRLGGVTRSDVQSNPLQPDLQYRGFTASPLLGTPQGLSVYQNGVRINEPFGDVVQWDLVPEVAIDEVQVIAGANPLYGLNSLGGSLALSMKNGFAFQGYRVGGSAGAFSRWRAHGEVGHTFGAWAAYAAASTFFEEGFRDASRSSAQRLYADLRRRRPRDEMGVNLTLVRTDLNGNGPAPLDLLRDEGRDAVFTFPDNTRNDLLMLATDLDRELGAGISTQATAYLRHLARATRNGDEAEFGLCEDATMRSVLCDEDAEPLRSEQGGTIPTDTPFDAVFNTSQTTTTGFGGSLQLSIDRRLFGRDNQFVTGTSVDAGRVSFLQRAEAGFLTPERTVLGQDVFLASDEFRTELAADNHSLGLYASETFSLTQAVSLHASGRFNWTAVALHDRGGSSALDGDHDFVRVNPAAGVTVSVLPELTFFASYAESSRAPSAAELSCADPDQPCRLPNAFIADPPLEQVVSRSVELGARGALPARHKRPKRPLLSWSLAGFASRNADDILFVAGSRVGTGYFRNAGTTARAGIELDLSGQLGPARYFVGYAWVRATFESRLSLPGGANPGAFSSDAGEDSAAIEVEPGDRMPGVPEHSLKAGVELTPLPRWGVGLSALARSGVPFRGDEANLIDDLDGYVVVNAHTRLRLLDGLALFVRAENLLDNRYETFGLLARADQVIDGARDPRFVAPGPPLAVFAGLTLENLE